MTRYKGKFEEIDRPTGPGETISEWMDDDGDIIREVTWEGPDGKTAVTRHIVIEGVTKEPSLN
jgi:hypothetical protein